MYKTKFVDDFDFSEGLAGFEGMTFEKCSAMPRIRKDMWKACEFLRPPKGIVYVVEITPPLDAPKVRQVKKVLDTGNRLDDAVIEELGIPLEDLVRYTVFACKFEHKIEEKPLGLAGIAVRPTYGYRGFEVFDDVEDVFALLAERSRDCFAEYDVCQASDVTQVTVSPIPVLWEHVFTVNSKSGTNEVLGYMLVFNEGDI